MMAASAAGRLEGAVALVTGASRGIGRAVARRYAAEGAHVVAVARTTGALEELDDEIRADGGHPATLVPMDLADFAAIDRLGGALFERHGRLDVLVGNAGQLGTLSPTGHIDPQTWQQVMDINVTANWRLIRSMDVLLRQAPAGRAIFVTSGITGTTLPYWSAYAASKAALEALALTYAAELNKTDVRVNLLDPGVVRTAMRAKAFPGERAEDLTPPEAVTDLFVDLALPSCSHHGERLSV
jgi:NAD(P)-dependent dehydrogenase (short-subunit alcohol dehydrogenase family)